MKKIYKRNQNLKYDFLPSALEIIEKPPSPLGKVVIYIVSILIFALMIWASICKIDEIVVSNGQVVPKGGIKSIDSNLNGMISKIDKAEGDKVKAGENILEIENVNSNNREDELESSLNIKRLELEILNRKIDGRIIDDVYGLYNVENEKLEEIKVRESLESDNLNKKQKDYEKTLKEINDNIAKVEDNNKSLETEYNSMDDVDKFIAGKKIIESIDENKLQIQRLKERIKGTEEEWISRNKQEKLDKLQERNLLNDEIKNIEDNYSILINNNDKYSIKSPVDGVIFKMNYNTVGSYVNQARAIAEIVPENSEYEMEAYILNKDISRIEVGQDVNIKLEAYDYQKYGTISGKVEYISPSVSMQENKEYVYKVKISLPKENVNEIEVLPGMLGRVEIKAGKTRIIDYFLKPFKKVLDESLKG